MPDELPLIIFPLAFFLIMGGAIYFAVRTARNAKRNQIQLIEDAGHVAMPKDFKPIIQTIQCSREDQVLLERYILALSPLIEEGRTQYSSLQFQMFVGLTRSKLGTLRWIGEHKVLALIWAVLLFPAGIFVFICLMVQLALATWGVSNFEIVLASYYRGDLVKASSKLAVHQEPNQGSTLSAEISQLHGLFTSGALTESEYKSAKEKLLKAV